MPREARDKSIFSTYYICQGSEGSMLFNDDKEKNIFMKSLKKAKKKYNFKLYAFCLLDSSYKLIIFDNGNDITKIMKSINVSYTMKVNKHRKTKGKIFKKRFSSKIIDHGKLLLELSKNIHLDAKKVKERFSSYCAYIHQNNNNFNDLIDTSIVLKGIATENKMKTYELYITGEESLENIVCEYNYYECIKRDKCLKTLDQGKNRLMGILDSENISYEALLKNKKRRNQLIKEFRQNSTLSLKEIGQLFGGISASGICKILNRE